MPSLLLQILKFFASFEILALPTSRPTTPRLAPSIGSPLPSPGNDTHRLPQAQRHTNQNTSGAASVGAKKSTSCEAQAFCRGSLGPRSLPKSNYLPGRSGFHAFAESAAASGAGSPFCRCDTSAAAPGCQLRRGIAAAGSCEAPAANFCRHTSTVPFPSGCTCGRASREDPRPAAREGVS